MKIGITSSSLEFVRRSGVKIQGIMWRDALVSLGHEAVLLNYWEDVDYSEFDAVVVLRLGMGFRSTVNDLKNYDIPVISAPIFDPRQTIKVYRLAARFGHIDRLHMTSPSHEFMEGAKKVSMFLVRSDYEKKYLCGAYDIDPAKVRIVPLSFRIKPAETMPEKESFCFHVSNLNAHNKNVERLIEAAKRYNFRLVLGGSVRGEDGLRTLREWIGGSDNITYTGQLSDEELRNYYLKAKVFALPSLWEGVGMVALEAAACGCEVVLTNHGAPKEYYNGLARLVNPNSIDDIGQGIMERMNCTSDGELMRHIKANYSPEHCAKLLEAAITECVQSEA